MTAKNYSLLAASVFTIVAVPQLARAYEGWPVVIGSAEIPVNASWGACVAAGALALLGFTVAQQ
jgi:hypothetical protein